MYKTGSFAFDDVTDRGSRKRQASITLPKLRKACKDETHLFSEYVSVSHVGGVQMITAQCPDCKEKFTFPALTKDRT